MTFSDSRVVDLVKSNFVAVWESVAPVSIAIFDLGDGRAIRGTMGGEIALYFCRPDGNVFDILPALHSPHVTYWAIRNALDFYEKTDATDEAIRRYHREKLVAMESSGAGLPSPATEKAKQRLKDKQQSEDPGTRALAEIVESKGSTDYWTKDVAGWSPELVVVVEPGGMEHYKRQVHAAFCGENGIELSPSPPPLRTPAEWKEHVFVKIFDHELTGGEFRYDVNTLAPISLIEE